MDADKPAGGQERRSPEQISNRLLIDFPEDTSMRISHEAIYQALYVQGRGALRRELTACLRTGRALRVPRERARNRGKAFVTSEILISERPASVEDRAVPGHWEGDLILGLGSSAIGTLVERTTRFAMLLHLPPQPGHRQQPRDKNGPALSGHGAEAVRDAITRAMASLPEQLRRTLTWEVARLHGRRFETRRDAMDEVIDWLIFYNHRRSHSTLGYVGPMRFEWACFGAPEKRAA